MKKKIFSVLMLYTLSTCITNAQVPITYDYDQSGNVIKKKNDTNSNNDNSQNSPNMSFACGTFKVIIGPSPTTGIIDGHVENYTEGGRVKLTNIDTGQYVDKAYNNGEFSINISHLPNGIYAFSILIINKGKTTTVSNIKIIKKDN